MLGTVSAYHCALLLAPAGPEAAARSLTDPAWGYKLTLTQYSTVAF